MIKSDIKNLLFDFGGVIIDLHIDRTVREFATLAGVTTEELWKSYGKLDFFHQHEKGLISDDDFRQNLEEYLGVSTSGEVLDNAWNAMLGNIPRRRLEAIAGLSSKYDVFLLSNTNSIHYDAFTPMITASSGHESLEVLFKKAYYSHVINMRKPDAEIFAHVLKDSDLRAEETLFLDDTLENLETASGLNIQTFHVKHPDSWLEII